MLMTKETLNLSSDAYFSQQNLVKDAANHFWSDGIFSKNKFGNGLRLSREN